MVIKNFDKAMKDLCEEFAKRYMGEDYDEDNYYMIWERDGQLSWPMEIDDRYFSLDDIYETIANDFPIPIIIEYHDYAMDCALYEIPREINFYNFCKYEDLRKEKQANLLKSIESLKI